MRRAVYIHILTLVMWFALAGPAHAAGSRIKDIAMIAGARDNQLSGFGLVTGLAGDGDLNPVDTLQTLVNLL
jgi:flagellar P-ring protein precursor FlgI